MGFHTETQDFEQNSTPRYLYLLCYASYRGPGVLVCEQVFKTRAEAERASTKYARALMIISYPASECPAPGQRLVVSELEEAGLF